MTQLNFFFFFKVHHVKLFGKKKKVFQHCHVMSNYSRNVDLRRNWRLNDIIPLIQHCHKIHLT